MFEANQHPVLKPDVPKSPKPNHMETKPHGGWNRFARGYKHKLNLSCII